MAWKRRRSIGIIAREVDGELLLLDTTSQRIHRLNTTAHFIWSRCELAASAHALARMLTEAFSVDETTALKDVIDTTDRFHALGLTEND